MRALLRFQHVSRVYERGRECLSVLDDVSFDIGEGDFVGVHGLRRSGKSTLLRIAAGWQLPDAGQVIFDGHVLPSSDAGRAKLRRRHGIGLVQGEWRPVSNDAAIQQVAQVLMCDRWSLRRAKEPALRALERVGLAESAYAPADQLSPAELVRLSLAMRLVHEPRVLLVDEPAVLSSPSEADRLYELLWSLRQDANLALVIASEELAPLRTARVTSSIHAGKLEFLEEPYARTVLPFPRSA